MEGTRLCQWCDLKPVLPGGKYCGRLCRQAAWRLRKLKQLWGVNEDPGTYWYADPGYIGKCAQHYSDQPDFAGEVDHVELLNRCNASLAAEEIRGYALSAAVTMESLKTIVPLLPDHARMCSWTKPLHAPPATQGLHNVWEALFIVGGRRLKPGVEDSLRALPAREWGELPGRKPLAFCAFLFDCLGLLPGDTLVDLYPGTGAVLRAWRELSPRTWTTPDETTRRLTRERLLPQFQEKAGAPAPRRSSTEQLSLLQQESSARVPATGGGDGQ